MVFSPGFAAGQSLDEVRKEFGRELQGTNIGAGYAQMLSLFLDRSVSLSRLEIDDSGGEFDIVKLPLRYDMTLPDTSWQLALRGTLSYAKYTEKGELFPGDFIDAEWQAESAQAGLGLVHPLGERWAASLVAEAGVSHLTNDADYRGVVVNALRPIIDGVLVNWKTNAAVYGLRAAAEYSNRTTRVRGLDFRASYNYSYTRSFNESRDLPSFDENVQSASVLAEYRHPWHVGLGEFPLFGVVSAGATAFFGSERDALGFSEFYQAGYALALDISSRDYFIKSFSVGYQFNGGPDVSGHSIMLDWEIR